MWLATALGQLVGLEGMRFTISLPPVLLPVFLSMEMRQAKQDNSIAIQEGNAREALPFMQAKQDNCFSTRKGPKVQEAMAHHEDLL